MAAEVAVAAEKHSSKPVMIDVTIMQWVLKTHVREQLEALANLRVSLGCTASSSATALTAVP